MAMGSEFPNLRVAMLQDGARLHYAVPISLQRAGVLERVFTDWYNAPWTFERAATEVLRLFKPGLARRVEGRFAPELDHRRIVRNPRLTWRLQRDRGRFATQAAYYEHVASQLASWVLAEGMGKANAFHGFITHAHATLFQGARQCGLVTTGDQILAPACVEARETTLQHERFPDWQEPAAGAALCITDDLERATWPHLSHIVCASDYVRGCLLEQGIDPAGITVVPYPLDTSHFPFIDRRGRAGPVTVGFVGGIGLRKGVQYVLQVARRFDPARVRFVLLGPVMLNARRLDEHRGAAEIPGPVARSQVAAWLEKFDLLLFPSTCEGSATAVMEAMATGLPIVTSPNSGTVVRHGTDGFIAPYDDIDAHSAAIEELARNPDRRVEMGRAARLRVEAFNLDWYSTELASVIAAQLP